MWIPWEEDDPVLWHYPGRKSVGYFGAVRLRDGKGLFEPEFEKFDGNTFFAFMRKLQAVSRTEGDRQVVAITDNAKYHHAKMHASWREEKSPGFVLDFLPPYSPELNPVERVWKRLRRKCLHNVYFAKLTQLLQTVADQFEKWSEPNEELTQLCRI